MFRLPKFATRIFLPIAISFASSSLPGSAYADTAVTIADNSCDKLYAYQRLRGGKLRALWTTNYHIRTKQRFIAATELEFQLHSGTLVGIGRRQMTVYLVPDKTVETSENAVVAIQADGKVYFNNNYGPYYAKCSNDKFISIDTGDSIEVISFEYMPPF